MTQPLKLLILSRYDVSGASSRLRTLQYIPALEAHGFVVTHLPLFGSEYLETIYRSNSWLQGRTRNSGRILAATMRRLSALLSIRNYDVIWLEKEPFPYLPGAFEALLAKSGVPYVVDYDDAIFHRYDLARSRAVRAILSSKLNVLLRRAFAVTVGNAYLAEYASEHGATRVEEVPTVLNIERYHLTSEPVDRVFRIGWIGSPSTASYISFIHAPLRALAAEHPIRLVTVGAPSLKIPGVPVEQHDWSIDSEVQLIEGFHIGVMPMPNSPWVQGKCGYKLIQYLACGRPAVASPTRVNKALIGTDAGFMASSQSEWLNAFRALIRSAELRAAMGAYGRARVEESYTLQASTPHICALLTEAAISGRKGIA